MNLPNIFLESSYEDRLTLVRSIRERRSVAKERKKRVKMEELSLDLTGVKKKRERKEKPSKKDNLTQLLSLMKELEDL